jgi:hypothetical protein
MNFLSARDVRASSKNIWEGLQDDGEAVITNNGRPVALLIDLPDGDFENVVKAVRQAKAMIAFNNMRCKASKAGFMTDDEIEAEIQNHRLEKKTKDF